MTAIANDRADAFLRIIRRSQRGGLKVYLGYAAGVGKTWQMLLEGHRLKEDGIDVVVGLVETHGRADTAKLVEGLEVVPRRSQIYRGITMEEMDTEAILRRKPQVALVDELALAKGHADELTVDAAADRDGVQRRHRPEAV